MRRVAARYENVRRFPVTLAAVLAVTFMREYSRGMTGSPSHRRSPVTVYLDRCSPIPRRVANVSSTSPRSPCSPMKVPGTGLLAACPTSATGRRAEVIRMAEAARCVLIPRVKNAWPRPT